MMIIFFLSYSVKKTTTHLCKAGQKCIPDFLIRQSTLVEIVVFYLWLFYLNSEFIPKNYQLMIKIRVLADTYYTVAATTW